MGCVSPLLHVTFPTADLADRKATMIQESDVLLALLEDLHHRKLIDKRPEAYLKVVSSIEELEAVIADL